MSNTAKLLEEHNDLAKKVGKLPLKSWKQAPAKLEGRIAELRKLAGKGHTKTTKATAEKLIKKEAARKVAADGTMTLVEVAKELKINPKVARAKMRRAGKKSNEGRWSTVKKGSASYKDLVEFLKPTTKEA